MGDAQHSLSRPNHLRLFSQYTTIHKFIAGLLLVSLNAFPASVFAIEPPPTIDNPQLFTDQSAAPNTSQTAGAFTERFQLTIPPGRNGLAPDLALSYNSQDLSDGIFGYGWSLSIPYIERLNKTGSERLYTDNYFTSSLGGELATTTTANEYRHRIEDGRFIKYTFTSNYWIAYDKNGTQYKFGTSSQAQMSATTSPSNVYRWMLEEVRDTNNNYVRYSYLKDGNQIYPYQIFYTGNGTTDGIFRIDFATSTRTDKFISYKPAFKVTTNNRITEIKAHVNGIWVRKYTLGYSNGVNGARSLLSSITETGRDEAGVELALPATTFTYSSSTPSYVSNTNPRIWSSTRAVADIDGNGLPDRAVFRSNIGTPEARRDIDENEYPTFNFSSTQIDSEYWTYSNLGTRANEYPAIERGTRFFDFNGDGKADVVRSASNNGVPIRSYAGNQGGFSWAGSGPSSTTIPTFANTYLSGGGVPQSFSTGILGNANGDGLIDYILSITTCWNNGCDPNGTYLSTGTTTGWQRATSTFTPIATMPTSGSDTSQSYLVDINADGLDDWMLSSGGATRFYLNTGTLWDATTTSPWNLATSTRGLNGWDKGIRFIDFNGDDLPDYVRSYNNTYTPSGGTAPAEKGTFNYVYLNTGTGFATSTLTLPGGYIAEAFSPGSGWWYGEVDYDEYVDWNGDGIPDNTGNTSTSTATAKNDILNKITYPAGGTKEMEYKYSAQFASTNPDLPFPVLLLTKVVNKDGLGNSDTTTYAYEGGKMYFPGDVRDRRFATFKTITKTDVLGVTKTYFNQGDSVDTATGERTDSWQQIGKPYREDVLTLGGATMRKTFTKWNTFDQGNSGRGFVYKESEIVEQYDGDSDHRDTATEYTYATSTGHVLTKTDRGEVVGNADGTYVDTGSDARFTTLTYGTTTPINLALLVSSTLRNNASSTVQQTRLYYDSQPYGSTTKGNLTKEEKWISGTTYASSTKAYNSYGLVTSEQDPLSRTTTYTIESNNLYVGTTTNALSHTTGYVYNYALGKPRQVTYPDGRTHKYSFDPVGRQKDTLVPDPSTGVLVTQSAFTYYDNIFPRSVLETRHLNSATSSDTYTYTDGLGRVIQERKESDGTFAVKDRIFGTGSGGMLSQESLPYFSTGTTSTGLLTSSPLLISYAYDALKRVTGITNTLGTETHTFDQWKETITDRESHPKDLESDAYGNLYQVTEYLEGVPATTTYQYDAANNLTKLTDAVGNIRNFGYDGLSRATTSQDLHAPSDTQFASTTYTYDLAGNLTSRLDQKNQRVNWTYDSLNRVLTEDFTGSSGTEVTYTYDSCTNGTSSLCVASSTSARTTNTYDVLGRVKYATTTIGGVSFATTQILDRQGNLSSVTYPNGSLLNYGYDAAGMLDSVWRKPTGGAWASIITNMDYGPTGAVTLKKFGSGATTTYTYDANELYRLRRISTFGPSVASTTATSSLPSITNPSHHWKLDESSGTAADSVGSMTLTNNNVVSYSAGKIANGGDFESLNNTYLNSNTNPNGSTLTAFTTSFWYKPESQPGTNLAYGLFSYLNPSGHFVIYYTDSAGTKKIRFYAADSTGATKSVFYTTTLTIGTWYHISATWDGTTMRLYVNGADTGTTDSMSSIYTDTRGTFIGATESTGEFTDGMIDEVSFWPSALTATDISNLYNGGAGRSYPFNASTSTATTTLYTTLQDIEYTYDKVGNILQITDTSSTTAAKTVLYTYDWLNRLTLATTTFATTSPFKRGFSYDWLGNLTAEGTSTTAVAPITAPTHYWKLDESSGTAADVVGSITLTNNNTTAYTGGKINNGADFESTNSNYLSSTTNPNGSTLTAFTTSFWFKPESQPGTNTSQALFTYLHSSGHYIIFYRDNAGTKNLRFYAADSTGTTKDIVYNTTLTLGTWYHITATWDGATMRLYVNGADSGLTTSMGSIYTGTAGTRIGNSDVTEYADGMLDEVGFWPQALTASDVTNLYNSGLGRSYPFAGGSSGASNAYTYSGTGFTNPHAVTQIANGLSTTTYAYDNNGNLSTSSPYTYLWNYNNWLTNINGRATSTYWYDQAGQRVLQIAGGATTSYPSRLYSLATTSAGRGTTTEYIFAGSELVATFDSSTSSISAPARYVHADHLGSTNVVSNDQMQATQVLDYLPYGATRVDTGTDTSQREFIGQFFDETTQMSYLNARYYEGRRGQFLSQDPTHWAVGSPGTIRALTGKGQQMYLSDPQLLNSYSYSRNSPIVNKDPDGTFPWLAVGAITAYAYFTSPTFLDQGATTPDAFAVAQSRLGQSAFFAASLLGPGGVGGGAAKAGSKAGVVFNGVWSPGKVGNPALNAIDHAQRHAADFGLSATDDYVRAARGFVTDAINGKYPVKIDADGALRAFDSTTNTFSVFRYNPSTGSAVINTFYKAGASYFDRQPGQLVQGLKALVKGLQGLLDKSKKGQ